MSLLGPNVSNFAKLSLVFICCGLNMFFLLRFLSKIFPIFFSIKNDLLCYLTKINGYLHDDAWHKAWIRNWCWNKHVWPCRHTISALCQKDWACLLVLKSRVRKGCRWHIWADFVVLIVFQFVLFLSKFKMMKPFLLSFVGWWWWAEGEIKSKCDWAEILTCRP